MIAIVSISIIFQSDVFAIQQTAAKIAFKLQPGQTNTLQWGFVSDSDKPVTLALRVEGLGSELLSFPKSVLVEPKKLVLVNITATIPNNYQNDIKLTPTIYAMQFGEKGGSTIINIEMKKDTTITIGNPPIESKSEVASEKPQSQENVEIEPKQQVQANPEGTKIMAEETKIDPEPTSESPKMISEESKEKKSGGCLIATAAYGSEMATQVQLLREVRDNVLLGTNSGTGFMAAFNAFYYSFSPTVADWERQSPVFKETVKVALTPMLYTLSVLNYVDIHSDAEMLGYGIGIILMNAGMYFVAPAVVIVCAKRKLAHQL